MQAIRYAVVITWIVFWSYWLLMGLQAKHGRRGWTRTRFNVLAAIAIVILARLVPARSLAVHSALVGSLGLLLQWAGLALAVWARLHLGRNWGMPTTVVDEPELVTSGPYRLVRHPIYSGLLLGVLGTGLVINLMGLAVTLVVAAYLVSCAKVEERDMTAAFPDAYPAYRRRTRMLVPHLL